MLVQLRSFFSFVLVAGMLFCIGSWLCLWLSGWRELAELYAEQNSVKPISTASFHWVVGDFCWIHLTVSLEAYPHALWLKAGFPLNFFTSSILILWEKIEVSIVKNSLFVQKTMLQVAEVKWPIVIKGEIGLRICEIAHGNSQDG